jgi:hypothetical protein
MLKTRGMKASALGLVLAALAVAAVGAQQPEPRFLTLGLLTVGTGEAILFNISHEDNSQALPAVVQMHLLDPNGAPVRTRTVTLAPGQSATLALRASGRFRPQAVNINPPSEPSSRRALVGCAEITKDDFTTVNRITCMQLPERPVPVGP